MSNHPHIRRSSGVEHEAARWLARHDRGLTAGEQDEFFAWIAADPRHRDALAEQRQTVATLRLLARWRPDHATHPNPDLLAQPSVWRERLRALRLWGLAAAVVLLCIGGSLDLPNRLAPAVAGRESDPPVLRKVLEDGSTIDLARDGVVEVAFTPDERLVHLVRGRAHFKVAKNPNRPFVVAAGGARVRAVGTAFDVHLESRAMEVLVTEGIVAVSGAAPPPAAVGARAAAPAEPTRVQAGYRTEVELAVPWAAPVVTPIAADDRARLVSWRPRELEFSDTPLAQVVAEFNRENHVKMVVDDPQLAALPIGATLRSDNVDGFVRLLERSFNVSVERQNDMIVLRARP